MSALSEFESNQSRAREARREAKYLRDLYRIATCGLSMKFNSFGYGTREVPEHIARRVSDSYLVWAAEYDVIADRIEGELRDALVVPVLGESTTTETEAEK